VVASSSRRRATKRGRSSESRPARPGRQPPSRQRQAERRAGRAARVSARIGYVARGVFYAVLAYLTVRIATLSPPSAQAARHSGAGVGSGGRPANANGALSLVSETLLGKIALAVAALGFFLLAVVRLRAAWMDHESGRMRRLSVAGQGLLYLALTWVPISYLAGNRSTGTEKQQRRETARLLGIPGGAVILAVIGVFVIAVCAWQLRGVLKQDFTDGLRLAGEAPWVRRLARISGTVGIAGRALVFVPIGIWLLVTAFTFNPKNSHGLDSELLSLAGSWEGLTILACIAVVMAVFAVYSFVEARYRDVTRSV
jgi:hypothetical protein